MKEYREKVYRVTDFYQRRSILAPVDDDRETIVIFDQLSRLVSA